jgi:hypothetical protein
MLVEHNMDGDDEFDEGVMHAKKNLAYNSSHSQLNDHMHERY